MTKEEYERLLKSDYWKGYSYSLIKERNFTCQDCGRMFPGERNKLQVHHLRYRDTNPWSYDPSEVVVLCEECHKKRHGLYVKPKSKPKPVVEMDENVNLPDWDYEDYRKFALLPLKVLLSTAAILLILAIIFIPGQKAPVVVEPRHQVEVKTEVETAKPIKKQKTKVETSSPQRRELDSLPKLEGIIMPKAEAIAEPTISIERSESAPPPRPIQKQKRTRAKDARDTDDSADGSPVDTLERTGGSW